MFLPKEGSKSISKNRSFLPYPHQTNSQHGPDKLSGIFQGLFIDSSRLAESIGEFMSAPPLRLVTAYVVLPRVVVFSVWGSATIEHPQTGLLAHKRMRVCAALLWRA